MTSNNTTISVRVICRFRPPNSRETHEEKIHDMRDNPIVYDSPTHTVKIPIIRPTGNNNVNNKNEVPQYGRVNSTKQHVRQESSTTTNRNVNTNSRHNKSQTLFRLDEKKSNKHHEIKKSVDSNDDNDASNQNMINENEEIDSIDNYNTSLPQNKNINSDTQNTQHDQSQNQEPPIVVPLSSSHSIDSNNGAILSSDNDEKNNNDNKNKNIDNKVKVRTSKVNFNLNNNAKKRLSMQDNNELSTFDDDNIDENISLENEINNVNNVNTNNAKYKSFTFDEILWTDVDQITCFNSIAKSLVEESIKGYNCTLFAYGQTGSGKVCYMYTYASTRMKKLKNKIYFLLFLNVMCCYFFVIKKTYTVFGPDTRLSVNEMGIVPRSTDYIFELLDSTPEIDKYLVKISAVEIYLEKLRDLLTVFSENDQYNNELNNLLNNNNAGNNGTNNDNANKEIKIRDTPEGIIIEGVSEKYVRNSEEALALLLRINANRTTESTNMNRSSSRSHCVVTFIITQKTIDETVKTSKLNFADLAGSEQVKKTGASGKRLSEASAINTSLTVLSRTISALCTVKLSFVENCIF